MRCWDSSREQRGNNPVKYRVEFINRFNLKIIKRIRVDTDASFFISTEMNISALSDVFISGRNIPQSKDMITKKVIDSIYKTCTKRPENPDDLNVELLFEQIENPLAISVEDGWLILHTVDPLSPFHKISLSRINCIEAFEDEIAVVLHSSIIFLNKKDGKPTINIKQEKNSIIDKLKYKFMADL